MTTGTGETRSLWRRLRAWLRAVGRLVALVADGDVLKKVAGHQAWGSGLPPDPAEAPDGQVPTTAAGAYELAAVSVGGIQVVTRTLTAAEISALNTTPIELAPSVAGRVYQVVSFGAYYHAGTVPWDSAGGLVVGQCDNRVSVVDGWLLSGDPFVQAVDQIAYAPAPGGINAGFDASLAVGEPLTIAMQSSDPLEPFGDGTVDVAVAYREVDVS